MNLREARDALALARTDGAPLTNANWIKAQFVKLIHKLRISARRLQIVCSAQWACIQRDVMNLNATLTAHKLTWRRCFASSKRVSSAAK